MPHDSSGAATINYEDHLGRGCIRCDASLRVVFVIAGDGWPPDHPEHHIGYEHRLMARCPACGSVQLEVYDHDCFDYEAVFDQYEWFVIESGSDQLVAYLAPCPAPLDRTCDCPRHRTMRHATSNLQRRPWRTALEHEAHVQPVEVRMDTASGTPTFQRGRA
ncbi:MAG: hypothetical protein PVF27_05055 [Gemmatimonadales bacterium]|jgi:hypothetical protein